MSTAARATPPQDLPQRVGSLPAIHLDRFSFRYPGQREWALHNLSLTIEPGEMVVIMGASGAGKTTLAKCLNRMIPAFHRGELEGEISIAGQRMTGQGVGDLAGTVALVSQDFESQLFATNVAQEVAFGMEQMGVAPTSMRRRLEAALEVVGLAGFESRDPATLSGGEKQRLAIAATFVLEPRILVLDEPTTDLDPRGKREVFEVLATMRQRGLTLVVIEHEIAAADHADRLLVLHRGEIVADAPPRVLAADASFLEAHAIRPSDLTLFATRLGLPEVPATIDEAVDVLRHYPVAKITAQEPILFASRPTPAVTADIISIEAVDFGYEPGRLVLRHAELTIKAGEFIALIGQNGSGKTTLAKHLNGLLTPSSGTVHVEGRDLRSTATHLIASTVGYIFQNPDNQIFAATVLEEVAFGPRNLGLTATEVDARVHWALEAVDLGSFTEADPFMLSKGHRQRLAVASILALRPRVLVLDEPTTGLDYSEQIHVLKLLAQLNRDGTAIVIITHSPWIISEYAKRGVLLNDGEIVFDGPLRDLLTRDDLLAEAHFVVPDIRRIANQLGIDAGSVAELAAHFASVSRTEPDWH